MARNQSKTSPDGWDIQDGFNCVAYDLILDLGDMGQLRNDLMPHRQSSKLSAVTGSQL